MYLTSKAMGIRIFMHDVFRIHMTFDQLRATVTSDE